MAGYVMPAMVPRDFIWLRRPDFFHADFGALRCTPGAAAWSIRQAKAIRAANEHLLISNDATLVGVMKGGKKFHHVTCSKLLCKGGVHAGVAFHCGTFFQSMAMIRRYNLGRETGYADDPTSGFGVCKICGSQFPAG